MRDIRASIDVRAFTGADKLLQRVHGAGRLVRAEHRAAPTARADRLDAASPASSMVA